MKSLTLKRYGSIPGQGTYGRIYFGTTYVNTIEQVWAFNEPFKSCVPLGEYDLVPFFSTTHKMTTFALRNADNGVWPTMDEMKKNDGSRYACILHAANIPSQLQGCIAVGNKFTWFSQINGHQPQMGVLGSSRQRTLELIAFIEEEDVKKLVIVQERCG